MDIPSARSHQASGGECHDRVATNALQRRRHRITLVGAVAERGSLDIFRDRNLKIVRFIPEFLEEKESVNQIVGVERRGIGGMKDEG